MLVGSSVRLPGAFILIIATLDIMITSVVEAITSVVAAVAALDMAPCDADDWVRCLVPACRSARLRIWAPGIFHCAECAAEHVFAGVTSAAPRRIRCARMCHRALFHVSRGLLECCECHAAQPAPFETNAAALILGPARRRRMPRGQFLSKRKIVQR